MEKPILVLDFDGVCHMYTSKWTNASTISDGPVPGMWKALHEYLMFFDVQILSSRSCQEGGIVAMRDWFESHVKDVTDRVVLSQLKFPVEKPPAFLTIDDRVVQFDGTWPKAAELLKFKPWNKRGI